MAQIYLNQAEVADLLRLSERTLERWRLSRQGPPFLKFGRRVVYEVEALERWAASNEVRPA